MVKAGYLGLRYAAYGGSRRFRGRRWQESIGFRAMNIKKNRLLIETFGLFAGLRVQGHAWSGRIKSWRLG